MDDTTATLPDLGDLGITYRQLDYWCRQGYLRPDYPLGPGSGRPRVWSAEELDVARRMGTFTRAGIAPDRAAGLARDPEARRRFAEALLTS